MVLLLNILAALLHCLNRLSAIDVTRCSLLDRCLIENAYLMGATELTFEDDGSDQEEGPLGVGAGSVIRNAIVDRNVSIGKGVMIENVAGIEECDRAHEGWVINSGLVTILHGARIPDGTVI
mmetsp:Transcript_2687/g.9761  ORF Transcript_2687/g.9761 Transcript_2687/m.9761 type:complete len:122 (+) Transcript_2687:1723-2088(+)